MTSRTRCYIGCVITQKLPQSQTKAYIKGRVEGEDWRWGTHVEWRIKADEYELAALAIFQDDRKQCSVVG